MQPHIINQVFCVYVAWQCEAGLKLVRTVVKRASSYPASRYKPSILCVPARQCEAGLKLVHTVVKRASAMATQPHRGIVNQVSCVY